MGSGNELVDYSRAPCLGADQKARGLWERDWAGVIFVSTAHTQVDTKTEKKFVNLSIGNR